MQRERIVSPCGGRDILRLLQMKRGILVAVVFSIFSAINTFILETVFNIQKPMINIILSVLFIVLGFALGIWTTDKKKK